MLSTTVQFYQKPNKKAADLAALVLLERNYFFLFTLTLTALGRGFFSIIFIIMGISERVSRVIYKSVFIGICQIYEFKGILSRVLAKMRGGEHS